jgi:hypothetical protein
VGVRWLRRRGGIPRTSDLRLAAYADRLIMRLGPTRWRRLFVVVVLVVAAALMCAGALGAFLHHKRVQRANDLAVRYGLSASHDAVSEVDRCTAALRDEYDHSDSAQKAGLPPHTLSALAPRVCSLAVKQRLVTSAGELKNDADGKRLTIEAIRQMGVERFQTMEFSELAVRYRLVASANKATRWDRCVAMGLSGYDAQTSKARLPSRVLWARAVRRACTIGVHRGLVPKSGAPSAAMTRALMLQALAYER